MDNAHKARFHPDAISATASTACPHRFDVRYMTHMERDDFATTILIDQDTVLEIDINDDVVELKVVEREVTEQDFV